MKAKERKEARRMRKEDGLPLSVIADKLGVSKGTVSVWVRDIQLTAEQEKIIYDNSRKGPYAEGQRRKKYYRKLREQWQNDGRELARERDPEFIAGCMLYWAEGSKTLRNQAKFSNMDENMMLFYVKFLRKFFNVSSDKMRAYVVCYTDKGLTVSDIEQYWSELLGISIDNFTKPQVDRYPSSSKHKRKSNVYGLCNVSVCCTEVIQKLYGAIQEFVGFEKEEWVM